MTPTSQLAPATRPPSATPAGSGLSSRELWSAVERFAAWLDASGYATFDPYDIWGTRYGKLARRLYYRKSLLGTMMTAPVLLMEMVAPGLRRFFVNKDRYATADAQLALAFLNLYEVSTQAGKPAEFWLTKARTLAADLLTQSVPGYHGLGWGYPFDWQHANGLMPKGTPHITATPYAYEVFTKLFELTSEDHYLEVARSIAEFVFSDLNDTATGNDAAASSYTPHDNSKVVNASAYRAFVLFDAARRFDNDAYQAKAWRNLRFILQAQREDGAWLYAIGDPAQAFIDHFHTCFVLKNLYKINQQLQNSQIESVIRRGYDWYRQALFDAEENPKSYAIAPRLQIVSFEMYDFAEAISLGVLLRSDIPEAMVLSGRLSSRLLSRHQLPAGHWVTRVYRGGIRHTTPYLRWPQAQLFLAVTNLLAAAEQRESVLREKEAVDGAGFAEPVTHPQGA